MKRAAPEGAQINKPSHPRSRAQAPEPASPLSAFMKTSPRTTYRLVFELLPADAALLRGALAFKCNNTAYRPVRDAVDLLARYAPVSDRGQAITTAPIGCRSPV